MTHTPAQLASWERRPFSWSQKSSWDYSPPAWYDCYLLGNSTPATPALTFGSKFSDAAQWGKPMAPITVLSQVEYGITAELEGLSLVGYLDTYSPEEFIIGEYKTGVKKWDQKRVDNHGQLTFYALLLYLKEKIKPEDLKMFLEWVPTCVRSDFSYGFTDPAVIHHFDTSRTMRQVLELAVDIKKTRALMLEYAEKMV